METQTTEGKVVLPRWKSHKEVEAFKINHINPSPVHDAVWDLIGETTRLEVGKAYMSKHNPQIGGYYVRYADGYESYSPAQAFEEGYTLKEDWDAGVGLPPLNGAWNSLKDPAPIFSDHKPPLGVMPENLWIEDRCLELNRAIARKMGKPLIPPDITKLITWTIELYRNLQRLKVIAPKTGKAIGE